MSSSFNIGSEMQGGEFGLGDIKSKVESLVAAHYGKIIIGLLIVIVLMMFGYIRFAKQGFMPSQTLYQQDQDTVGVGSENTPQGLGVGILGSPGRWYLPGGAALTSEAVGYCSTSSDVVPEDAWEWQYKVATGQSVNPQGLAVGNAVGAAAQSIAAQEKFKGKKSDDTLSAIAQGF